MDTFDEAVWQARITRACTMRGLIVRQDAVAAILRQLRAQDTPERALDVILRGVEQHLEQTKQPGIAVDETIIQQVLVSETRNDEDVKEESILIKSAFLHPKFSYDATRHVYTHDGHQFPLQASADVLARLHRERFALTRERLMRNPLFAPPMLSSVRREHLVLTPVDRVPAVTDDALEGSAGDEAARPPSLTILGTLTQPSEGLWCIEDETGVALPLDLSQTHCLPGMFTETAIVLVQGRYYADARMSSSMAGAAASSSLASTSGDAHRDSNSSSNSSNERQDGGGGSAATRDSTLSASARSSSGGGGVIEGRLSGAFVALSMSHPPAEPKGTTLHAMGIADPLVVSATLGEVARERKLLQHSQEARNTMFVFASNVHFDSQAVMNSLERLFRGFSDAGSIPALFVFMGPFTSQPFSERVGAAGIGRRGFEAVMNGFADLLAEFPDVTSRARIVLVPGPHDPGASMGVLPQPPLPASLCGRLVSSSSSSIAGCVTLATNPVRIRFLSQEIVVFRGEVTTPLRRRAAMPLVPAPPEKEATEHMVRTVLDQAHLSPLPLNLRPVYWSYDHALRLCPTPDALVIGESVDSYVLRYNGCLAFNPGSFANEGRIAVYNPVKRRVGGGGGGDDDEDDAIGGGGKGADDEWLFPDVDLSRVPQH